MLRYSGTLTSARAYAEAEKLGTWIHLYLNNEGRNVPFSEGLKLSERYYIGPAPFPVRMFHRCAGPEAEMPFRIDPDWWEHRVAGLEEAIRAGADLPPLIVHYVDGAFEVNDGNHRHKAYENLGVERAWAVVWITEKAELDDFLDQYGEFVKGCKIMRG